MARCFRLGSRHRRLLTATNDARTDWRAAQTSVSATVGHINLFQHALTLTHRNVSMEAFEAFDCTFLALTFMVGDAAVLALVLPARSSAVLRFLV